MKKLIIFIILSSIPLLSIGQFNQYYPKDTTKARYPYTFPIFGNFLHDIGIELPYPVGIMANSYMAEQKVLITDISIGFEGGEGPGLPMTDVTRLLEFEANKARALSLNVRPDIWVLPFLNIYGIVGKAWTETDVTLVYPIDLKALAKLEGMSFGIGGTFAGGYKDFFAILDINRVWTYMDNFEQPVGSRVMSPRIGKTFWLKKEESNFGFWVGAMSVRIGGTTSGSIKIGDVLPPEIWENTSELVERYYAWYESVDDLKQKVADKVFTPIVEKIANGDGNTVVNYSIAKESAAEWNMLVGAQYQLDRHLQFRTEFGFLGERKSWLLSANYRFGIAHKK